MVEQQSFVKLQDCYFLLYIWPIYGPNRYIDYIFSKQGEKTDSSFELQHFVNLSNEIQGISKDFYCIIIVCNYLCRIKLVYQSHCKNTLSCETVDPEVDL